jgi:hypothetical protein
LGGGGGCEQCQDQRRAHEFDDTLMGMKRSVFVLVVASAAALCQTPKGTVVRITVHGKPLDKI